jgi:hypothetical protein
MTLRLFSGAWGNLIHKKTSLHCPFKFTNSDARCVLTYVSDPWLLVLRKNIIRVGSFASVCRQAVLKKIKGFLQWIYLFMKYFSLGKTQIRVGALASVLTQTN